MGSYTRKGLWEEDGVDPMLILEQLRQYLGLKIQSMEWGWTTTYIDVMICEVAGNIYVAPAVLKTYLSVMSMDTQCMVRYISGPVCVFQNLAYKPEKTSYTLQSSSFRCNNKTISWKIHSRIHLGKISPSYIDKIPLFSKATKVETLLSAN